MKLFSEIPPQKIAAVMTDLDDTLTVHGHFPESTYKSLWDLKELGIGRVIVSGRPAGWADALMRLWPIDAMIFENGAGVMIREGEKVVCHTLAPDTQKQELETIFQNLKQTIPHLRMAKDQPFRKFDFAIDICEEPPHLTPEETEWLMGELGKVSGITYKLSSIHINYWKGDYNKQQACLYLLKYFGWKREEVFYVGDSPNDEPLFEFFDRTVGVSNIRQYTARMQHLPRFLTQGEGGFGFVELVNHFKSFSPLSS